MDAGVHVLSPDRRRVILTGDCGHSCRWELRARARGRRSGGGEGGGDMIGRHLDSSGPDLLPSLGTVVDQFLHKKNDGT